MEMAYNVAIVTGGANGIGEATAIALAHRGCRVVVADLDGERAAAVAARIIDEGAIAMAITTDVADPASIKRLIDQTIGTWGSIDILVNSAGLESSRPFLEISLDEYERVMRVNSTGTWLCCQAVLPMMIEKKAGSIVNISSVAGQRGGGLLGTAAYAASKGAVIALTKSLAREFSKLGIRVNAVAPSITMTDFVKRQLATRPAGYIDTILAMTPIGRAAVPSEIAAVAVFLAMPESSFVTGHVYNVDGGTAM
jgi:NAD(P)-dependent dehydrogenase (short-subunit alcohol dehydrogenase family)